MARLQVDQAMWDDSEFPLISGAEDVAPVDTAPPDPAATDWTFPSDPGGLTNPPPVDLVGLDPAPPTPDMSPAANPTLGIDLTTLSPAVQQRLQEIESANTSGALSPTEMVQGAQMYADANNALQPVLGTAAKQGYIAQIDQQGNRSIMQLIDANGNPIDTTGMTPAQLQQLQAQVNAPGSGIIGRQANEATDSGLFGSISKALGPLSSFLGTPAGRLLGALGVGGLATGLGALMTQNRARVSNAAATTPNAGTIQQLLGTGQGAALTGLLNGGAAGLAKTTAVGLQGTGTLADLLNLQANQGFNAQAQEQPLEQGVGMAAVGQLPGQMNATTNPNITGTATLGQQQNTLAQGQVSNQGQIMGGLAGQIKNVLNGQYSNPILENQIKLGRDAFNAKMYAQLGSGWETSTPGMQAKQQQDLLESSQRFQDQQSTLANYTPLYSGMVQGTVGNQSQATGQVQQAQNQGVTQNVALSQLGKQNPSQLTANLNTLAPPTAYAGLNSAAQSQSQLMQNQQQANLVNSANQNAANNSLAQGIGQIGGIAAAGLMSPNRSLLSTGGTG